MQHHKIPLVEILVDAIGRANDFHEPDSAAYQLRSPLLLQSFAVPGKHIIDQEGRRVFPSSVSGYKAAVFDMGLKITGNSRAKLKPEDKLIHLLGVYKIKDADKVDEVVEFLKKALTDPTINRVTPLSYFIEETNVQSSRHSESSGW